MCGFVGLIGTGIKQTLLAAALPTLARRGPDSNSTWIAPDANVGLLHVRLAIVDADARANQPFVSADKNVVLAFNGEIYNYHELRAAFPHYPFRTDSDTETIVACYQLEGVAGLARLKGMFSLALVDTAQQRVLLMRDAIGKKPLFVARMQHQGENLLAFGSTLSALMAMQCAHFGRHAGIRAGALIEYWQHAHLSANSCVLNDAQPLAPGTVLSLDFAGKVLDEQRLLPTGSDIYNGESAQECSDRLSGLLETAVKRRLDSVQKITVLLSGGIDSTVVTHLVHRQAKREGRPVQALTLAALIPGSNDERFARYAAKREGLSLTRLKLPRDHLSERICQMLDVQDEPLGFISYFLLAQLVQEAANHGKILITGDGGDEVFLGYGKPSDWQQQGCQAHVPNVQVGPALPAWMSAWGVEMACDALAGHGFTKADRASAEQGVELRCPLLDWDVVAYARSLPVQRLFPIDTAKSLLKQQLSDWPEWFRERPKMGFTFNLRWFMALRGFAGVRESFVGELDPALLALLPQPLRCAPRHWRSLDIFRHFTDVWKALAWHRFVQRAGMNE